MELGLAGLAVTRILVDFDIYIDAGGVCQSG